MCSMSVQVQMQGFFLGAGEVCSVYCAVCRVQCVECSVLPDKDGDLAVETE